MNHITPTDAQKVQVYEGIFHRINLGLVCGNNQIVRECVEGIDAWSYAHRRGNGELSEEQEQAQVNAAFWRLAQLLVPPQMM